MTNSREHLAPCPFCGCSMRVQSNRDWHRLMGDHAETCVFMDEETMMVPASDEQLEIMVGDWNTRYQAQAAPMAEPVATYMGTDWDAQNQFMAECADLEPGTELFATPQHDAELVELLIANFPLLDDEGLCEVEHHCEWAIQQDRKRLHKLLASLGEGGGEHV